MFYPQSKCDCCGRFMRPGAPGTSWVLVPGIDVPGLESGDERDRCADCTVKYGRALPGRGPDEVRYEKVCGIVNAESAK